MFSIIRCRVSRKENYSDYKMLKERGSDTQENEEHLCSPTDWLVYYSTAQVRSAPHPHPLYLLLPCSVTTNLVTYYLSQPGT